MSDLNTIINGSYQISSVRDTQLMLVKMQNNQYLSEAFTFKGPVNVDRLGQGLIKLANLDTPPTLPQVWKNLVDSKCCIELRPFNKQEFWFYNKRYSSFSKRFKFDQLKKFLKDYLRHAAVVKR